MILRYSRVATILKRGNVFGSHKVTELCSTSAVLARDKNVGTLLDAFASVAATNSRARLIVVGDGELADPLRAQATTLGIFRRTTFQKFVSHEELVDYYRAADVTVVPSDKLETFCMVAIEAIASGCPLIVTDQVPEIVSRFPDVAVVTPYDKEAFCDFMIMALDGKLPPVAPELIAQYSWLNIATRYRDIYNSFGS